MTQRSHRRRWCVPDGGKAYLDPAGRDLLHQYHQMSQCSEWSDGALRLPGEVHAHSVASADRYVSQQGRYSQRYATHAGTVRLNWPGDQVELPSRLYVGEGG